MTKNTHFIGGNGLKKHLPEHGVSLIELLQRMVSWVECTALNWIFHRLDNFFQAYDIFFRFVEKPFSAQ